LPVSLDYSFLIATSLVSNVYSNATENIYIYIDCKRKMFKSDETLKEKV